MRPRKAVALSYSRDDEAPRIEARGTGLVADRIVSLAREAGVPVVENAPLAELLGTLDYGTIIPEPYWEAVAGVLALVMELEEGI
ncbi:MAG: EscU/YscU/HrcU family type III secretion system export apparatus switch protein [Treponemataceae bacterium]